MIPQQAWGPTYKNAKRNPKAPPAEAPQVKRLKANREITAPEVRLVGTDGTHQVMPLAEALRAARNAKLDLVQVAGIACCCQMLVTLIWTVYRAFLRVQFRELSIGFILLRKCLSLPCPFHLYKRLMLAGL